MLLLFFGVVLFVLGVCFDAYVFSCHKTFKYHKLYILYDF